MNSPVLIGIGAGFVSAVLSASAAVGSVLALILFYLAPLPIFLAGLGWGTQAVAVAALSGTIAFSLALGFKAGIIFFLSLALPASILCYLSYLSRSVPSPQSQPTAPEDQSSQTNQSLEWFPLGWILAWAGIIGGILAAFSVLLFGTDIETYKSTLSKLLDQIIFTELQRNSPQQIPKEQFEQIKPIVMRALPAASAIIWLAITLLNLWLAARIVEASGRLARPRPDISKIHLPTHLGLGLVGSIVVSFVPGVIGLMATGFFGALFFVYVLFGLIIIHTITQNITLRFLLLTILYLSMLRFGWISLAIAMIGMGEPIFNLRQRAKGKPPPGNPPGQ